MKIRYMGEVDGIHHVAATSVKSCLLKLEYASFPKLRKLTAGEFSGDIANIFNDDVIVGSITIVKCK